MYAMLYIFLNYQHIKIEFQNLFNGESDNQHIYNTMIQIMHYISLKNGMVVQDMLHIGYYT